MNSAMSMTTMEKADPIGQRLPCAAHGHILARKVSGWRTAPVWSQSGTPFRAPRRFGPKEAAEKTDRFWSARAPAPLSRASDVIGRLGAPEDLGFPAIVFLGKDEEHDGAGRRAKTAIPDKRTQALDAP
jgi:hypothetical protein